MTKVGEHITLDIIGTTKEYDPSIFEKVINEIAKVANVKILNIPKYKFLYLIFRLPIIFQIFSLCYEVIAFFLYLKNRKQIKN